MREKRIQGLCKGETLVRNRAKRDPALHTVKAGPMAKRLLFDSLRELASAYGDNESSSPPSTPQAGTTSRPVVPSPGGPQQHSPYADEDGSESLGPSASDAEGDDADSEAIVAEADADDSEDAEMEGISADEDGGADPLAATELDSLVAKSSRGAPSGDGPPKRRATLDPPPLGWKMNRPILLKDGADAAGTALNNVWPVESAADSSFIGMCNIHVQRSTKKNRGRLRQSENYAKMNKDINSLKEHIFTEGLVPVAREVKHAFKHCSPAALVF